MYDLDNFCTFFFWNTIFICHFLIFRPPLLVSPRPPLPRGPLQGAQGSLFLVPTWVLAVDIRVIISNVSECKIEEVKRNEIVCVTSSSDVVTSALVKVEVDNWKPSGVGGFSYVTDPTFVGIEPTVAFKL